MTRDFEATGLYLRWEFIEGKYQTVVFRCFHSPHTQSITVELSLFGGESRLAIGDVCYSSFHPEYDYDYDDYSPESTISLMYLSLKALGNWFRRNLAVRFHGPSVSSLLPLSPIRIY
jgi:hypothetical protein